MELICNELCKEEFQMKNYIILFMVTLMLCGVITLYAVMNRYEVTQLKNDQYLMIVDKWYNEISYYDVEKWSLKDKTKSIKSLTE